MRVSVMEDGADKKCSTLHSFGHRTTMKCCCCRQIVGSHLRRRWVGLLTSVTRQQVTATQRRILWSLPACDVVIAHSVPDSAALYGCTDTVFFSLSVPLLYHYSMQQIIRSPVLSLSGCACVCVCVCLSALSRSQFYPILTSEIWINSLST